MSGGGGCGLPGAGVILPTEEHAHSPKARDTIAVVRTVRENCFATVTHLPITGAFAPELRKQLRCFSRIRGKSYAQ
jgi:hypothetical protein